MYFHHEFVREDAKSHREQIARTYVDAQYDWAWIQDQAGALLRQLGSRMVTLGHGLQAQPQELTLQPVRTRRRS